MSKWEVIIDWPEVTTDWPEVTTDWPIVEPWPDLPGWDCET